MEDTFELNNVYSTAVANLAMGRENLAIHSLVRIFLGNDIHKTYVFGEIQEVLLKEAEYLCSTTTPSLLRDISKDCLETLSTKKLSAELEVRVFYSTVIIC